MIGIRKLHSTPVVHFDTAGDYHWADLEAARFTIQLLVNRYGSVCVLEMCAPARADGDAKHCPLLWDQIAEYFTASEVRAVSIVCDMDAVDVCSGALSNEDSHVVEFFPVDHSEDALTRLVACWHGQSGRHGTQSPRTWGPLVVS